MKPPQKIDSFIVRIWREPGTAPRGPELVRGSIEHMQSRKKQYFQSLESLVEILQAQTAPSVPEGSFRLHRHHEPTPSLEETPGGGPGKGKAQE